MKNKAKPQKPIPHLADKVREGKLREFEFLGESLGGFFVSFLEIAHEALSLRDHFEESAAGMEIFLVLLQVIGQLLDPLGKHRNLIFR